MKTKSTVRPREIQRTVLNLERSELGLSRVEDAIIRLHLHGCGENAAGFVIMQLEHAGYQLTTHHDEGPFRDHPALVQLRIFAIHSLVDYGVVENDDFSVHFHGVRDQNGIAIDAQQAFGQAGLTIA